MHTLILVRHGQSTWNLENRFTGWTNVSLTEQGEEEAKQAGVLLKEAGYNFDIAYTSFQKRAIDTLTILLKNLNSKPIIEKDWRLNERHYGALQGLNKSETTQQYGQDQVFLWRRSYDTPPPALEENDPRHPKNDPLYKDIDPVLLPATESLKLVVNRVIPYWKSTIAPQILAGKHVLICAHGNSLRALIKYIDAMNDEAITKLNIPTGIPLVYKLNEKLHPVNHYYLGDADAATKAAEAVANQSHFANGNSDSSIRNN